MFERMEVAEQVYAGGAPYKITNHRVEANRTSHGRKINGG